MNHTDWMPTLDIAALQQRAALFQSIRAFFAERGVMEVETPILSHSTNPAPHLASLSTTVTLPGLGPQTYYLQTSPEFHMKRLLAAGSGPIYQLFKTFRDGEMGQLHNPEFTLLEWYRPGFTHHDLMQETDLFLQTIAGLNPAIRMPYDRLFQEHLDLDPETTDVPSLMTALKQANHDLQGDVSKAALLEYCLDVLILPLYPKNTPLFVYDFPASQAQLARLTTTTPPKAARFEVYVNGIELANAFHELSCPIEQKRRFEADLAERAKAGQPLPPLDHHLLNALPHLPDTAGIALGIDRLHRLIQNDPRLAPYTSFAITRS